MEEELNIAHQAREKNLMTRINTLNKDKDCTALIIWETHNQTLRRCVFESLMRSVKKQDKLDKALERIRIAKKYTTSAGNLEACAAVYNAAYCAMHMHNV